MSEARGEAMDGPATVQVATLGDVPEFLEHVRCCAEAPRWPDSAWHELLSPAAAHGKRACVLLLRDNARKLTGWAAASLLGPTAEVEFVFVDRSRRARGWGGQLLAGLIAWAVEQGAEEVLLEVRLSNAAAQVLYRKAGFAVAGQRRDYYREPSEDAVCMRLDLHGAACS